MLKLGGWPERVCINLGHTLEKMAVNSEDFLYGDDLEAVLAIVEANMLDNDADFEQQATEVVDKVTSLEKSSFPCSFCKKVCLSKGGLTRHINAAHPEHRVESNKGTKTKKPTIVAEEKLQPSLLGSFFEKAASKLAHDKCYPDEICDVFKNFKISDISTIYDLVKPLILCFDGNGEIFYPKFYKIFIGLGDNSIIMNGLSQNLVMIIVMEVANMVLAHLSGATYEKDVITFSHDTDQFTERETSIIAYISGYVFGTMYRRIRFSKSERTVYHQQCLSFLLAGKCTGESKQSEHQHVELFDRGGLWKVNRDVIAIFSVAESYFLSSCKNGTTNINSVNTVSKLMENSYILMHFSNIRDSSPDKIRKEVALNLLEDLLTLYIRVRTFSYVKDKVQAHKIQQSKNRTRSLRTSLKQKSAVAKGQIKL